MKINISPEDIFTFQQHIAFADGYIDGLAGKEIPPARVGDFSVALHRLGHLCGNETRKIDQKDVKASQTYLHPVHRKLLEGPCR